MTPMQQWNQWMATNWHWSWIVTAVVIMIAVLWLWKGLK